MKKKQKTHSLLYQRKKWIISGLYLDYCFPALEADIFWNI